MDNKQVIIKLDKRLGTLSRLFRDELKLPPKVNDGLVILVRGLPGTGKTTLALQLAQHLPELVCLSEEKDKIVKSVYLSLDQNPETLESKLDSMLDRQVSHDLKMKFRDDLKDEPAEELCVNFKPDPDMKLPNDISLLPENLEKGFSVLSHMLSDTQSLFSVGSSEKGSVLLIDGLSSIPKSQRLVLGVDRIFDRMRKLAKVSIVIYEPDKHSEENYLDYMADMVIELRETQLKDSSAYLINEMHILKARYQNPARGWHQYKIRDWGLEFFPSLHFQVHQKNYMPTTYANSLESLNDVVTEVGLRDSTDSYANNLSVIEGIVGSINPGSNIALLGSRGCFKTELCRDFLFAGTRQDPKDDGLLISLIDNFDNLNSKMPCPKRCGKDKCSETERKECIEHLHLFHQRPGCITPAEFLYYIIERLDYAGDSSAIRRLAFWDFTQLDYRFPIFFENKMFIPALMDTLKFKTSYKKDTGKKGVGGGDAPAPRNLKSVLMGAGNAKYTKAVSAIADNVIFCWRDKIKSDISDDKLKPLCKIKGSLKLGNIDVKKINTWLLLYVDRREKPVTVEHNNLYCFPVIADRLILPGYAWKPLCFAMPEPSVFVSADGTIKSIREQQGLE